jgi:hypothetical protein
MDLTAQADVVRFDRLGHHIRVVHPEREEIVAIRAERIVVGPGEVDGRLERDAVRCIQELRDGDIDPRIPVVGIAKHVVIGQEQPRRGRRGHGPPRVPDVHSKVNRLPKVDAPRRRDRRDREVGPVVRAVPVGHLDIHSG